MLSPEVINIWRRVAARTLRVGAVELTDVPDLARALLALEFEERAWQEAQKKKEPPPAEG